MWTIDPKIPLSLWWALAIAGCAAIAWYASRRDHSFSAMRRVGLSSLLLLGLLGPLLIVLNPTWVETVPPLPGNPMLTVLVDGTSSMKTIDCGTGGDQSRLSQALESAALLDSGSTNIDIRRLLMADEIQPLPNADEIDGAQRKIILGHKTDLSSAIRSVLRSGATVGHAVLLISDGANNVGADDAVLQAAREAKALATPVYTLNLGTSLGMKNLSITAKSSRMIAFPDNPVVIRATLSHSGLAGKATEIALLFDDKVIENQRVVLGNEAKTTVSFTINQDHDYPLQRYRIIASEISGEATVADNQTTVLVQRLNSPVEVLFLEGKPYWDSKFLSRNLTSDPVVKLTEIVQLSRQRFLRRSFNEQLAEDWSVEQGLESPLESQELLSAYKVILLGRDADPYLTPLAVENLREWVSESGGCLVCSRGAPTDQVVSKLAEILPVRWQDAGESRFRTRLSGDGMESAVFDSLISDSMRNGTSDPLAALPSLASSAIIKTRVGLPQVLVEGTTGGANSSTVPVVTYQPYGRGQTVVVEGAGMWRWAFLPPQHAEKDSIYPMLWQSMVQWIVSQQDVLPGQQVAIRSDRANFLSGDPATASVTILEPARWHNSKGGLDLDVLVQSADQELPKRVSLIPSGMEETLFRADLGSLDVGYYSISVVTGEKDEVLAATAFEVRDPWFENLEVDARPDLMQQISYLSGGQSLQREDVATLVQNFADKLKREQRHEEIRTSMWDRPSVLVLVLVGWMATWIVRRRSGLI